MIEHLRQALHDEESQHQRCRHELQQLVARNWARFEPNATTHDNKSHEHHIIGNGNSDGNGWYNEAKEEKEAAQRRLKRQRMNDTIDSVARVVVDDTCAASSLPYAPISPSVTLPSSILLPTINDINEAEPVTITGSASPMLAALIHAFSPSSSSSSSSSPAAAAVATNAVPNAQWGLPFAAKSLGIPGVTPSQSTTEKGHPNIKRKNPSSTSRYNHSATKVFRSTSPSAMPAFVPLPHTLPPQAW
jgi:hypothetical protein